MTSNLARIRKCARVLRRRQGLGAKRRLRFLLCSLLALLFPAATASDEIAEKHVRLSIEDTWVGDFDGMVDRRLIRVLVVYNKMLYFLDKATQRGIVHDAFREFEKKINKDLGRKTLKVRVIFIPVRRDELLPALVEGRGDIAAANLTITPERQALVDFSMPTVTGVKELVVTSREAPELQTLDDLAGKTIHVRRSSSYFTSLQRLNGRFEDEGKAPIELVEADEFLEDSDLLEMVNANLIPMVVVDSHKADFWAQIFDNILVHEDIAVNEAGKIAWAIRKNSPKWKEVVDGFVKKYRKGTLLGNIIFRRYLQKNKWARNNVSEEEIQKFESVLYFFREYGSRYGFDWVMLGALAYQESQLDHSKRSPSGAIGIMQVLPRTAKDPNVGIPRIERLEDNIHAGTKYLRFLYDRYYANESMDDLDKMFFTFASYNAGPAKINKLRKEAAKKGLDPQKWFGNVEVVAAKRIGRETVQYVSNIYKYYIAYRLIVDQQKAAVSEKRT